MTDSRPNPITTWLKGGKDHKPVFMILAAILFAAVYLMPTPQSMTRLLTTPDPTGYETSQGTSIVDHLNKIYGGASKHGKQAAGVDVEEAARKVKIVTGMIVVAALLWGTVSLPVGATAFLLVVIMYVFKLMPTSLIAKVYMKDAVFFIIGALALAVGVEKTKLDRRIGLLFLGWSKSKMSLLFLFGPLIAIAAMFVSAKCLIAFLMPVLMRLYKNICRENGLEKHNDLGLFIILVIVYMTAMGGPGAPTVGARNVIMMDIFAEVGKPMTFIQWMQYGFWFVPVGSIVVGFYLLLLFRKRVPFNFNPGHHIKADVKALGKFKGKEATMAAILLSVVFMWIFMGQHLGLGGPAIIGVVLMFVTGLITWKDMNDDVAWGVVWMYAAAVGLGKVILETGTGLWLATMAFDALPNMLKVEEGLLVSISILTTITTNLMSDGAAVAVIGPIAIPMHEMADLDVWQVGLATAFSSSFAHCLVVGRPGLVIAYTLGVDPETKEQLLSVWHLFKYGLGLVLISWLVLWGWTFFGYWKLLPFA